MSVHTERPSRWYVVEHPKNTVLVIDGKQVICHVDTDAPAYMDHARLIAEGPAMLRALQEITAQHSLSCRIRHMLSSRCSCHVAIAQATIVNATEDFDPVKTTAPISN